MVKGQSDGTVSVASTNHFCQSVSLPFVFLLLSEVTPLFFS
jgi:hypothetical protein